ncbi:MAG: phosphatase PAP2 family protein, partial [Burkholderiaceae bacterium]|nr:phosphatase PAP2 family protein [Burkholderiaceae bacterium]
QTFLPNHPVALADQALTDAIRRTVSLSTLQVFAALTVLANTPVQWAVAIVGALILLWRRDYFLTTFWIAAIAGNGTLTRVLKATFERARPLRDHDLFAVQGWSFPSGHASGAVAIYGALSYVLIRSTPTGWHLPIVLGATAIAFTTGCGRIFLQVHYASDVLAGFAFGLAWLSVCVMTAEAYHRTHGRA